MSAGAVITVTWYRGALGSKRRAEYDRMEISAGQADEDRIMRRTVNPGESMATRQTGRGLWQTIVYPVAGSADVCLAKDGSVKMAIDYRTMKALGFRWRRRWCGKR